MGGFSFSAVEGALSDSQTVAQFTDPGGPEALGDYSATIAWGDGNMSAGSMCLSLGAGFDRGLHAATLARTESL